MSRPKKCRRICDYPQTPSFVPEEMPEERETVVLSLEEYETIRLIDREGYSQEQCGDFMQVARTTVQQIYASARRKLADVLVEGLPLRIEGGDYQLCNGGNRSCGCSNCYKQKLREQSVKPKGEHVMRVAITYENGEVFQHFGHAEQFKIYDIEGGRIVSSEVVDTNGSGHGALAGVLRALQVDALICGGIGGGARMALSEAGIALYGGVSGSADAAAEDFAAGRLNYDPNARCDHHEGEHACGNHGCGDHPCG
ncbi:MAG: DUF134 domain-containing protein [Aristaeellaceae bacterium]